MNLVKQVRTGILEHQLIERGAIVVVGVSGGPDSLALLHVLRALALEFDWRLQVAHLNHQLRGAESDADEKFVLSVGAEWGLPVANASWDVAGYARENHLSVEEAARQLRYQFLAATATAVGSSTVAVAHNADDQAETVLMHFLRGSGLAGLRGMRAKNRLYAAVEKDNIDLIRPFLDIPRALIEAYCAENNLQPRIDATNLDTKVLRNRLRHEVVPYLEQLNPNLREVLRHSSYSIADDYDYIHTNVLGIYERMTTAVEGAVIFDGKWFRALPVNLQRGVLREAVMRLSHGLRNIGWGDIETARRVALNKGAGAEATLPRGLLLVVGYDEFTIGETKPLPDMPLMHGEGIVLQRDSEVLLPESDWMIRVVSAVEPISTGDNIRASEFDTDKVHGALVLRPRRAGDRFAPSGMHGKHKSLHEFMIDEKIPRHLRELIPILTDEEKILWVCGYREDERARVSDKTTRLLRVEFVKAGFPL